MKTSLRTMALLSALVMLFTLFTSCESEGEKPQPTTTASSGTQGSTTSGKPTNNTDNGASNGGNTNTNGNGSGTQITEYPKLAQQAWDIYVSDERADESLAGMMIYVIDGSVSYVEALGGDEISIRFEGDCLMLPVDTKRYLITDLSIDRLKSALARSCLTTS